MTIQKYDWVSKDIKHNANGWSEPLSIILLMTSSCVWPLKKWWLLN